MKHEQKSEGACRLCGVHCRYVDSHVFPRALAGDLGSADDPLLAIDLDPTVHLRRVRTGVYGQFLCETCEARSQAYDQVGVEFLRRPLAEAEVVVLEAGSKYVARHDVDPEELKLFVLWCLWRAAASGRGEFSELQLGPLEESLRRQILADDPGSIDDFSVVVELYADDPRALLIPWAMNETNVRPRACMCHLHGHSILVKVDSIPFTDAMRFLALNPENPVVMPIRSLVDSPHGDQLRRFMTLRGPLPPRRKPGSRG